MVVLKPSVRFWRFFHNLYKLTIVNELMKLIFPQEVEVWYVLPAIRKRLAMGLIDKGMSQKEVARVMSLTEAAISQYKKEKRARADFLGTTFNPDISAAVNHIFTNNQLFFSEVMKLNNQIKNSGVLCDLHKKIVSVELPCDSCELKVCM